MMSLLKKNNNYKRPTNPKLSMKLYYKIIQLKK